MQCPYCQASIPALQARAFDQLSAKEQVLARISDENLSSTEEACPSCGKTMHIRRHPATGETYLLDKKDACSLNSMRLANLYLNLFDDPFAAFLSDDARKEQSIAQAIWNVLDDEEAAARSREDWNTLGKLLLEKARYRCSVGEDFFPVQREALRCQLKHLQRSGATKVRIVSGHDGMVCARCAEHEGIVLSIEEALESMPLPVRCDASSRRVAVEDDRGWCRCFYARKD